MDLFKNNNLFIIFLIFIICFNFIGNTESIFSYGMQFAKVFKLNNGNIVIIGDLGIHTYDSSGTNSLYNSSLLANYKITEKENGIYTGLSQFSKENKELVIATAMHVLYILNPDGKCLFPYPLDSEVQNKYYSIVPYIYKDNYYHFILTYIKDTKITLQYYLIDLDNEDIIPEGSYKFDQNSTLRESIGYDYGASCHLMNHYLHGIVLTCFYQDNEPKSISVNSFKLKNKGIVEIPNMNTSYPDFSYGVFSSISLDRKKCLVCYVRSTNTDNRGYCAAYNIDENSFTKYKKYVSQECNPATNTISVNYFKETKEFIFSCNKGDQNLNIVKFDDNLDVIPINENEETQIQMEHCYATFFYSILFMSNDYIILGDFNCDGGVQITTSYSISSDYKPSVIYNDTEDISLFEDNSNDEFDTDSLQAINPDVDESSTFETEESISSKCEGFKNSDGTICSNEPPKGYYILDLINKIIEKCHITCETCEREGENGNNNCLSCKDNFEFSGNSSNCIYKYNYYYDNVLKEIIYLLADELCPEKLPYEIVETKECVESCTNKEFINKECIINYFSENNINSITNKLKSIINETTDSKYDVIIDGNNIIYEVTSSLADNEHHNISNIDFGECENILKRNYSIDYLLIFKMDAKLNESYPTVVEYEVYSPVTKEKLNLSLCKNTEIDVYVPINLDTQQNDLYEGMSKNGIDILNENNSFYNDICTPFTSNDGTDMTLSDRQKIFYDENVTLCENSCKYIFYNSTSGKAKCQCQVKTQITEMKKISFNKLDLNTLLDLKTFSNIELIKCYKLTFSKKGISNNYGSIIIILLTASFIGLIIIYLSDQKKLISRILRLALKAGEILIPPRKKTLNEHFSSRVIQEPSNSNHNNKNMHQTSTIRDLIDSSINVSKNRKSAKRLTIQIKNFQNINVYKNSNKSHKKNNYRNTRKSDADEISVYPMKEKKNENNKVTEKNRENIWRKIYTDYELNNLLYEEALLIDKRTYFEYFWSLIRSNHILLFIFMQKNDYNLILIKVGLFIFSFCLYFSVNALFFTDKKMHKIYEGKGIFNLISQLPQILYSTLITSFINMIIKKLALSEKMVIELKKIKDKDEALRKSTKLYRSLMLKFNLFFFISLIFMVLFWYYISTFCAVYKNTQITLILNTLICFIFTLIYPFVLRLLPGAFRIPALRAKSKNKENLYKIGNIIALI